LEKGSFYTLQFQYTVNYFGFGLVAAKEGAGGHFFCKVTKETLRGPIPRKPHIREDKVH
jgi:hypothetical protein